MPQSPKPVSRESLAEIAHDLNNQLNLINGFVEVLDERYGLDAQKHKENIALVREAIGKARALTRKLTDTEDTGRQKGVREAR